MPEELPSRFEAVFGVDFSGAALAGRSAWVARLEPEGDTLRLEELSSLEALAGDARRGPALEHLVGAIRASRRALWGIDAPFGLPVEVMDPGWGFPELSRFLGAFEGDAPALGRLCVARALRLPGGRMHLRRATDVAVRTPFDCYHYRIVHQTFHAIRDVLSPLDLAGDTAILPFRYARLPRARRVVVEACPSSTLKRLGLPFRGYKQPAGGELTPERLETRRSILRGLRGLVRIPPGHRRTILADPGADALDAVLAGVGALAGFLAADHAAVARDGRAVREGYVFA